MLYIWSTLCNLGHMIGTSLSFLLSYRQVPLAGGQEAVGYLYDYESHVFVSLLLSLHLQSG